MYPSFENLKNAVEGGLALYGDYLARKLSALYQIGMKKGKTRFGYLGDAERYESGPVEIEGDEEAYEEYTENMQKWQLFFLEISDYVENSRAVSGVTYVLEERAIWVARFQERWEGSVVEDDWFRVYPHSVENRQPLVELMELIAEELGVDLDEI